MTVNLGVRRATPNWHYGEVVVDVDPRSRSIMFGLGLTGEGRVWMSSAAFEAVDESVPVTTFGAVRREPRSPKNLDLSGNTGGRDV